MSRADQLADELLSAYQAYVHDFHAITRRAPARFETRDWTGSIQDGLERLRLYKRHIDAVAGRCSAKFGLDANRPELWNEGKAAFRNLVPELYDCDLALMFFDSVMRRALPPETVVPYGADSVAVTLDPAIQKRIVRTHDRAPLPALLENILRDAGLQSPYRDLADDVRRSAEVLEESLRPMGGPEALECVEVLRPLFYRNKGAYLVTRIRTGGRVVPLAFAFGHTRQGIVVDAVLTEEIDLRRIFSYTRSNFHVELDGQYREVLDFLHSLMPHKNWTALYSSIGFINPSKIQLSKDLDAHRLAGNTLTAAWGIPGMVMVVFTSPGFPYVFKVIRDDDKVTKSGYVGHPRVIEKYRLVQEGDRVGRLLDTITFHNMRFRRADFDPKILRELLYSASASVKEVGDDIVVTRCYAQRESTPLPIYLRQADWPEIHRVLNDLGWCLKHMAAAGLFPGEFDLKNFGVAEDGRVVFFDFDGLDELGKFGFDDVPLEASLGQEECFEYLLNTYRVNLVDAFRQLHPDLFTAPYWKRIQRLLEQGEVLDTFPYPAHKRLKNRRSLAVAAGRNGLHLPPAVEEELERLGLNAAHRRGLVGWQSLHDGIAVGRVPLHALSGEQQSAARQTFGADEATAGQNLGAIVIDGVPAFTCLLEPSSAVVDLSDHYAVEGEMAAEWRERVQREVFGRRAVEFRRQASS